MAVVVVVHSRSCCRLTDIWPVTHPTPVLSTFVQVYNFNVPTFGKGVVYDVDQKVRTEQFRFFTEALKKDRLKKYVPMFAAEAEVSKTGTLMVGMLVTAVWQLCICQGSQWFLEVHGKE